MLSPVTVAVTSSSSTLQSAGLRRCPSTRTLRRLVCRCATSTRGRDRVSARTRPRAASGTASTSPVKRYSSRTVAAPSLGCGKLHRPARRRKRVTDARTRARQREIGCVEIDRVLGDLVGLPERIDSAHQRPRRRYVHSVRNDQLDFTFSHGVLQARAFRAYPQRHRSTPLGKRPRRSGLPTLTPCRRRRD